MELRDYMHLLQRHWALILTGVLCGLLVGGATSVFAKPTYTAETQLFVAIQSSGSISELQQGNTFSQARVQSYVKTVDSPLVLQPAIDELGLSYTTEELAERVKATNDVNTVLIDIKVDDNSPVQAAALAQAVSDSLIDAVDSLETPRSGGSSPVGLSVTKPATTPLFPSSPNTRVNLLLGLLLGLFVGVLIAFLRSTLDNRIRGVEDLRRTTDKPLLGGISFDQDAVIEPLLTQAAPQSVRAESFRQLRTNLQFANISGRAKSILITSSVPGEGKSTTAANLAIAMAQAGQSVCLVDADLRRPMLSNYLGLERDAGLTTALLRSADVDHLLQSWGEENLFVLTSGQVPPNPSELLGSVEMRQLLGDLEARFDVVIVDAPPLLPVTDAAVLSQHVGGVVVVVGYGRLKSQELERSMGSLSMVGANILGVVLNRLPSRGADAYSYTYYSADETSPSEQPGRRRLQREGTSTEWEHSGRMPLS